MSIGKQYLLSFTTFFNSTKGYTITFNLHENVENKNEFPYEFLPWNRYEALIMDDSKQGIKSKVSTGILYPVHKLGDIVDVEGELDGNLASAGLLDYFARVNQYIQTTGGALGEAVNDNTERGVTDFFHKLTEILEDAKAEVIVNVIKESGTVVTVFRETYMDEDEVIKVLRFTPTYDIDVLKGDQAYSTFEGVETRYKLSERQEQLFEVLVQPFTGVVHAGSEVDNLELESTVTDKGEVVLFNPDLVESVGEAYGGRMTFESGDSVHDGREERTEAVQRVEPEYETVAGKFDSTETFSKADTDKTDEAETFKETVNHKVTSASRLMQILYGDRVVEQIKAEFRTVMDTYEEEVAQFGAIRSESLVDLISKASESPTTDVEMNGLDRGDTFQEVEKGGLVSADTYQVTDLLELGQGVLTRNIDLESFREAKSFLYSWVDKAEEPTNVVKEEVTINQLDIYAENISVVHATVSLFIDMLTHQEADVDEFDSGETFHNTDVETFDSTYSFRQAGAGIEETEEFTSINTEFVAIDELFSASESSAHTDARVSEDEVAMIVQDVQEVRSVLGDILSDVSLDGTEEAEGVQDAHEQHTETATPSNEGLEATEDGTDTASLTIPSTDYDIAIDKLDSGYGVQEGYSYSTQVVADSVKYVHREETLESGETSSQADVTTYGSGDSIVDMAIHESEKPLVQETFEEAEIEVGTDPSIIIPEGEVLTQDKPNDSTVDETIIDTMDNPTALVPLLLNQELKEADSINVTPIDIIKADDGTVNKGADLEIVTSDPGQFLYPEGKELLQDHGISVIEQDIDKLVGESGITQSGYDSEYQEMALGEGQAESEASIQGREIAELYTIEADDSFEREEARHARVEEGIVERFQAASEGVLDTGGHSIATQAVRKVEEFVMTLPVFPLSIMTLLPSREELTKAVNYFNETEGIMSREEAQIIDHLADILYSEETDLPVDYTNGLIEFESAENSLRDNVEVFLINRGENTNEQEADHASREEFTLIDRTADIHELEYQVTEGKQDGVLEEPENAQEGAVDGYMERNLTEGAKEYGIEATEATLQRATQEVVYLSDKPHTMDESEVKIAEGRIEEIEYNVGEGTYDSRDSGIEGAFYQKGYDAEVLGREEITLQDHEAYVEETEYQVVEGGRESHLTETETADVWISDVGSEDRIDNASIQDPEAVVDEVEGNVTSGSYQGHLETLEGSSHWYSGAGEVERHEDSILIDPQAEIDTFTGGENAVGQDVTVQELEGDAQGSQAVGEIVERSEGCLRDPYAEIDETDGAEAGTRYEVYQADLDGAEQSSQHLGESLVQEVGQIRDPEAAIETTTEGVEGSQQEVYLDTVERGDTWSSATGDIVILEDMEALDKEIDVQELEDFITWLSHQSNTYDRLEQANAIDKYISIDQLEANITEAGIEADAETKIDGGEANVRLEAEVAGILEDGHALDKEIEIGDFVSAVSQALEEVYLSGIEGGYGSVSFNATIDQAEEMTVLDGVAEITVTDSGYVVSLAETLHSTIESATAETMYLAAVGDMEPAVLRIMTDSLLDEFVGAEVGVSTDTDLDLFAGGEMYRSVFADLPDRFEEGDTAHSGREADLTDFDSSVVGNAVNTYLNEVSGGVIHSVYEVAEEDGELAFVGSEVDTDIVDIVEGFQSFGMYALLDRFVGGVNETTGEAHFSEIEGGINETDFYADLQVTETGTESEGSVKDALLAEIEGGHPTVLHDTYHVEIEGAAQADGDFFVDMQEYEGSYNEGKGSEIFIHDFNSAGEGNVYWDTYEPRTEQASGEVELETMMAEGFDLALINVLRFEGYYHKDEVGDTDIMAFEAVVETDETAGVNMTAVDTYLNIDEHANRMKRRITLPEEDDTADKQRRVPVFIEEDDWAGRRKAPVVMYDDEQAGRLAVPVVIGDDEQAQRTKKLVEMVYDEESAKTKVPIRIEDVQSGDKTEVRRRVDLVEDEHAIGRLPEEPPYEEPREAKKMWLIMGKQFPAWSGWNPKKTR